MSTLAIATRRTTGKLGWAIFGLAVVGLLLSAVSLVSHYRTSPTSFCDVSASFDCDLVNRSVFSEIAGIPVAGIGVAGYILLMVLSRKARDRRLSLFMLLSALGGLAFALYLTYIEAYILEAWCIFCLGSLGAITAIALLSSWHAARIWRS
jgi:uncharacterized membrane protein